MGLGSIQEMQTQDIDYAADGAILRGYLAFEEGAHARPGVLVFHEGLGLGDFAMEKARQLASLGYSALAADMFGERRQAQNLQEVATIVGGLRAEPERLRARAHAAVATLAGLPQVDASRLAAIGFCFGGSVVLELARSGVVAMSRRPPTAPVVGEETARAEESFRLLRLLLAHGDSDEAFELDGLPLVPEVGPA